MSGSMKGEHRGAAKREAKRGGPPKGVSGNPEGKPKGTLNRSTRRRIKIVADQLGVDELNGIMPATMLLNISRIFYKMAMNDQLELEAAEARAKAQTAEDGPVQDIVTPSQLAELGGRFRQNLIMAGDHAYKAANYYHPRLQALAIAGAGGSQSPADVLRSLLDEIDGEARVERQQVRQLEHAAPAENVIDEILKDDDRRGLAFEVEVQ